MAATLTVVAYAAQLTVAPKLVGGPLQYNIGTPEDPAPLDTKVAEALEMALDQNTQPRVKTGIIPWAIVIDWALQLLLKRVFQD